MTYRAFHACFTLPLVVVELIFLIVLPVHHEFWYATGAVAVASVLFTYPWDTWAIRRGIWDFPADRIWRRIGVLPVEEIAFFVVQTVIVALGTHLVGAVLPGVTGRPWLSPSASAYVGGSLVTVWIGLGWYLRQRPSRSQNYARHLFYWFCPLIGIQWVIGGHIFVAHAASVAIPAVFAGGYLSCADVVAVRRRIWFFDRTQTTGHTVAGLPWEEVAFFVLTSLLVAQSIVLLLPEYCR